jgi:poly(A) polymerase
LERLDESRHRLLEQIIRLVLAKSVPCFVAGGYVRELVLGRQSKDMDLVVPEGAISFARSLADGTAGAFYVLDRDTDAARIVYSEPVEWTVDVAALRAPDIVSDLRLRDFTINAMAIDVRDLMAPDPPILDPCNGRDDLRAGTLRATSGDAFRRDPVRLLRAVRFVAVLDLKIEPDTQSWMLRDSTLLPQASAERVRQELALIMAADSVADHLRQLDRLGLLQPILPEVAALKGVSQSPPHVYDVFEHMLVTVSQAERLAGLCLAALDPDEAEYLGPFAKAVQAHFAQILCEGRRRATLLKIAAMLHDVGKPATRQVDEHGRIRATGHEALGQLMTKEALRRLRFCSQEIRLVSTIVSHHMRPGWLLKAPPVTPRAVYRFFRDTGDAGVDVVILALADQLATRGETLEREHWRDYLRLAALMLDHYFNRPSQAVNPRQLISGDDVMTALHLEPGPEIGRLLEAVREAQASGVVHTREDALAFLQRHIES